ncbi:MAG: hypothetical protein KAH22_03680 [Thiotrichaceae bacterium]|nr:hypothetical protein [Thiotrichaceae bacterium]
MLQILLEKWGLSHINNYLDNHISLLNKLTDHQATKIAILLSFVIGFIVTLATVYLGIILFPDQDILSMSWAVIFSIIVANICLILIEFWLLFHITLLMTALYIHAVQKQHLVEENFKRSLIRAAFELDEPEKITLGINPYRKRKTGYWLIALLYKVKIILSNLIAKVVLKKIISRGGSRMYIPYIATIITGFWDAWVQYVVLKEVRLRIYSRVYVLNLLTYIKKTKISNTLYDETLIRLIAVRLDLFGLFNINIDYLLNQLEADFPNSVSQYEKIYDIDIFSQCYAELSTEKKKSIIQIAIALFAFKRGFLSKEEKKVLEIFNISFAEFKTYRRHVYKVKGFSL